MATKALSLPAEGDGGCPIVRPRSNMLRSIEFSDPVQVPNRRALFRFRVRRMAEVSCRS